MRLKLTHSTVLIAGLIFIQSICSAAKPNPEACFLYDAPYLSIADVYAASCTQSLTTSRVLLGPRLFARELEFSEAAGGICFYYALYEEDNSLRILSTIGTSTGDDCEIEYTFIGSDVLFDNLDCEFAIKELVKYLESLNSCE